MTNYLQTEYRRWMASPALTPDERDELGALTPDSVEAGFSSPLRFGTAGIRGTMGPGPGRLNARTVAWATHAVGLWLLKCGAAGQGVCIGFDGRRSSGDFARLTAEVLAGLKIPVFFIGRSRPTPLLSYAVRARRTAAGICITASHNPPAYNGYKVYRSGGAQIADGDADAIAALMAEIDPLDAVPRADFDAAVQSGLIVTAEPNLEQDFLSSALRCISGWGDITRCPDLPIVYTPFHGVGGSLAPEGLRRAGLTQIYCVARQMEPDGDFPTTPNPNPEDPSGFALALELAEKVRAALILANDPDADRVAVWARDSCGVLRPLTGNQVGVLLTDALLSPGGTLLKTIVTTDMAAKVARARGGEAAETFTGFKYLSAAAERLTALGRPVPLAFEEAIGYRLNPDVPDKDGISAALAVASLACRMHARGLTLHDRYDELGREVGFHAERTVSITLPGTQGRAVIDGCMASLRARPPVSVAGRRVANAEDFLSAALDGHHSDVLRYTLDDGCRVIVRPSGTEPKIKLYALARGSTARHARERAESCARCAGQILRLE